MHFNIKSILGAVAKVWILIWNTHTYDKTKQGYVNFIQYKKVEEEDDTTLVSLLSSSPRSKQSIEKLFIYLFLIIVL